MIDIGIVAASGGADDGPFPLALIGFAVIAFGLYLLLFPRRATKPTRLEYKFPEQVERSEFVIVIVQVFGVIWTIIGVVTTIRAFTG